MIYIKSPSPAQYTIVYSHANAEDIYILYIEWLLVYNH